jgi:hypothetical protein
MTIHEKLAIGMEAIALEKAGKKEEALRLEMTKIPMEPWMAKVAKEKLGADYLRNSCWNLTEADDEFGPGWLDR